MVDILFTRTFLIIGGMLLITAMTARINKAIETAKEYLLIIAGTIVFLFAAVFFADIYPINLVMVAMFSAVMGWQMGPAIEYLGERYQLRRYLKSRGVTIKKGQKITEGQKKEFEQSIDIDQYKQEWRNVIFQALLGTALAVFSTAGIVFLTSIDFSFLGGFLFISLSILILMGLINIVYFHSKLFSLARAYLGAVIFTLYLVFDFNRLEKYAGDETWSAAIDVAVNIYLDIVILFLDLLEILAESD